MNIKARVVFLLVLFVHGAGLNCTNQPITSSRHVNRHNNEWKNRTAEVFTNLGTLGNSYVVKKYQEYVAMRENSKIPGCSSLGDRKRRLLVTGFGRFLSSSQNISGLVAGSMMDPNFWNNNETLAQAEQKQLNTKIEAQDLPHSSGATAKQRTLTYNGNKYEVCLLTLAVQWDLAAAIMMYETEKFEPAMIIMTGLSEQSPISRLEYSATNQATNLAGYDANGRSLAQLSLPEEDYVLPPSPDVLDPIDMSWDNQLLAQEVSSAIDLVNKLEWKGREPFQLKAMTAESPNNNYICNNISFVTMHALLGLPIPLAGGELTLQIPAMPNTKAGFLHFGVPSKQPKSPELVYSLSHLVMSLAEAEFNSSSNN